jgi:hypothetical protein
VLAVLASRALGRLGDNDLWWHLRLGRDLIHQRSLAAPSWSPLGTQAWAPTEPLWEIVAAWLQAVFGWAAIKWLWGASLLGLAVAVYLCNRRLAAPAAATLSTVAVLLGCSLGLAPRPQLVSFALVALVLGAWLDTEQDLRPRWWLVPLTWLWSLVHGMWIFGVGYGVVFVVALGLGRRVAPRQWLRLALVPVLSAASVLLNPAGLGVIEAPFLNPQLGQWIAEWEHTQPVGTVAALAVEIVVLETVGLWVLNRRRLSWSRVLLLLTAVFWLYYAYRTVAVAAVVMGPLLAEAMQTMLGQARARQRRDHAVAPVTRSERRTMWGASAAILVALALAAPHTSMKPEYVPTTLDPVLDRLPAGTVVFNDYGIGGWLRWRHDDLHPVIDGLATPYSATYFDDFHAALDAKPGWRTFVRGTGAEATLLSGAYVLRDVLRRHGWVLMASAEGYQILLRPDLARRLGLSGS